MKKYLPHNDEQNPQVNHVMCVSRADEIATMSTTVRYSWEKAGFRFMKKDGIYYLWVNKEKIRSSPAFLEVWQVNYPKARLSQ
jgi:hypothetical protein